MHPILAQFANHLTLEEQDCFHSLNTPTAIQTYLDNTPYSIDDANYSPAKVMHLKKANCFDGALFAAAALRQLGFPPLIIDLLPAPDTDDDHVLAIFKMNDRYGALAKSNFAGLRFREPVYRTLRELVMSYFDVFFNVKGEKTLRGYTLPLNLSSLDSCGWMWDDASLDQVIRRLGKVRVIPVINEAMAASLSLIDQRSYQSGLAGANPDGLYKPH